MRFITLFALLLGIPTAFAQLAPDEFFTETMDDPGTNWFISKTGNGGYIFDAETGEMQGLLSLSRRSPTVVHYQPRREFYAAESYASRGVHGERTDIVAFYDFENLSPIAEVIIPNHMARLQVKNHLALLNSGRHLVVHNMNPGHSVSIVDVEDRVFVYEISTPGCAVNLPVAQNDFLQVCGDGTLQLIQLDLSGFEENRVRSEVFFNVIEDAVFDRTAQSSDGWFLITHAGVVFEVSTDDDEINISDAWNLVPEGEEAWRPGGEEFISAHMDSGLLFVAMHQGPVDTHHVPGTEIWVYDTNTRRRVHRMEMEVAVDSLMVTQEASPKLIVADEEGGTHVYDALTFAHERQIQIPGSSHFQDL